LGEAVPCREIGADDFDVALLEDVADVPSLSSASVRMRFLALRLVGTIPSQGL